MQEQFVIHHGDNREVLKTLADNSVDSVVTDPPYELGFMGKSWDASGIAFNTEVWQECLRVLKPGGHLLAFSGSRTYHRMAVAIEDAGFEIRDQIMWIYGSGFPKSLDIGKAIDKRGGSIPSQNEFGKFLQEAKSKTQYTISDINEALGRRTSNLWSHFVGDIQPLLPTYQQYKKLKDILKFDNSWDHLFAEEAEREVVGTKDSNLLAVAPGQDNDRSATTLDITAPATAQAKQWQGWGTALKPAHEPIVVARKPLIGTVAANVLTYGTGGLNIDGSRVGNEGGTRKEPSTEKSKTTSVGGYLNQKAGTPIDAGRWPANVIHDGSDEVVGLFPDTAKGTARTGKPGGSTFGGTPMSEEVIGTWYGDSGSAARFFYCAKASKRDRNEGIDSANHHPTVKPTDLMRYLCRLVTPPNGTVLDPFMGSGSTGKAAIYEGFNFVGIEMTDEYIPIAKARIEFAVKEISEQEANN